MLGRVLCVLAVAAGTPACGRVAFDAAPDAAPGAAPDAALAQVVTMASQESSGTGITVSLPPTSAGSVLLLAFTTWDVGALPTSVSAGSPLALAAPRATQNGVSAEIWYSLPAAGTTSLTVTLGGTSSGFDVWIVELRNVAAGPPAQMAMQCLAYPPDLAVARVTTTAPDELVFGLGMFANPVYVNGVDAPFTALPFHTGNGAAYLVAEQPGTYGPSFQIGQGAGMAASTCATTIAFSPAT